MKNKLEKEAGKGPNLKKDKNKIKNFGSG